MSVKGESLKGGSFKLKISSTPGFNGINPYASIISVPSTISKTDRFDIILDLVYYCTDGLSRKHQKLRYPNY